MPLIDRRDRCHGNDRRFAALAVTVALGILLTCHALADTPKRPLPDYGGQGPAPTTPGTIALWVPRILLAPLYLTSEYLIRRPLGAAISAAERAQFAAFLYDLLTIERRASLAPIAFVDFGFNPDVGVYAYWDDALFQGNDLRVHGAVWTSDWLAGSFTERIHVGREERLLFKVSAVRRPDYTYYGMGPSTLESNRSRYGKDMIDGRGLANLSLGHACRVLAGMGLRSVSLYAGHFGGDPSVPQAAAANVFALPYGFDRGYTAEYNQLRIDIDTRREQLAPGTGLRVELAAEQGNDVRRSPASGWIRYSATAGAFLDLNDLGRVISVSLAAFFADPLGSEPIPFTELVLVGGDGSMRGLFPGRLTDRSALVATARYRWPMAPWLDGSMRGELGNVFGVHLTEFRPGLLRLSAAVGFETVGSPDGSFEALVGFGTETFEHGAQVDSIRLVLGTNRGF